MKTRLLLIPFLILLTPAILTANVIVSEDFEDSTLTYSQTPSDNTLGNGMGTFEDYYGRIGIAETNQGYTGFTGQKFWAAQNTDGDTTENTDSVVLSWNGIDITNFSNLMLSGDFASFDNLGNNELNWDPSTSVRIQAQIDGGGFFNVLAFESINNSETNKPVREDVDFDGDGDITGYLLTDNLTNLLRPIAGTGNSLDIRIFVDSLNNAGEDIAFDNVQIIGDLQGVPEPTSLILFGSVLGICTFTRRRTSWFSFLSKN